MDGLELVEYKAIEDEYYKLLLNWIKAKIKKLGKIVDGYEMENGETFEIDMDSFYEFVDNKNEKSFIIRFYTPVEKDEGRGYPILVEWAGGYGIFVNCNGELLYHQGENDDISLEVGGFIVTLKNLEGVNRALDNFLPHLLKLREEIEYKINDLEQKFERDWSGVKI